MERLVKSLRFLCSKSLGALYEDLPASKPVRQSINRLEDRTLKENNHELYRIILFEESRKCRT
jgi:hypothetical protein